MHWTPAGVSGTGLKTSERRSGPVPWTGCVTRTGFAVLSVTVPLSAHTAVHCPPPQHLTLITHCSADSLHRRPGRAPWAQGRTEAHTPGRTGRRGRGSRPRCEPSSPDHHPALPGMGALRRGSHLGAGSVVPSHRFRNVPTSILVLKTSASSRGTQGAHWASRGPRRLVLESE